MALTHKENRSFPSITSYTMKSAFTSSTLTIKDFYITKSYMVEHKILKLGDSQRSGPWVEDHYSFNFTNTHFFSVCKKSTFPENITSYKDPI